MKLAKLSALGSLLVLLACQFTSIQANATCNAPNMEVEYASTSAAITTVTPNSGCTIYLDSVDASLYSTTALASSDVFVVGATTSACTTITNYFARFPLTVVTGSSDVSHTIDFGQNGIAMPSGDGPYLCVKFGNFASGDLQYINLRWHSQ